MQLPPEQGREVPDGDPFWTRRVRDGDVTVEEAEPKRRDATQRCRPGRSKMAILARDGLGTCVYAAGLAWTGSAMLMICLGIDTPRFFSVSASSGAIFLR
jgi:hypothetical protein